MKNDSLVPFAATIQVKQVKYDKGVQMGIDFSNEIDIWAKMEFRYSQQVKDLQNSGSLRKNTGWQTLNSIYYSVRERMEF